MDNFTEQLRLRGFEAPQIVAPSKSLIEIASLTDIITDSSPKVKTLKQNVVIAQSQSFLSKYFEMNYVPFYKEYHLSRLTFEKYGQIHPFYLPIKKIDNVDQFYGCTREVLLVNKENPHITNMRYRYIELSKELTELAILAYTHELTHTQINHERSILHESYNIELLSIFLELVNALEYDEDERLLRIHDAQRLGMLKEIILELEKYHDTKDPDIRNVLIESTTYLHGTLKAYRLFFIYYFGDISTRNDIMHQIQRVFNHKLSVEDFLNKYGITFSSCEDKEELKKYLKRG